jgi:hypothetical protein
MEPDFSGYVTKAGLKCSDGRTITADAFKHMDGKTIPLVYQHGHQSINDILGHTVLEARSDGMYGRSFFNDSEAGKNAKLAVQHGDITMMSIYANQLVEKAKQVLHGMIREVSLVLSGANPGALIDYVNVQHSDDPDDRTPLEDEAVIYTGLSFEHTAVQHATQTDTQNADPTGQEIYDTLTQEQRDLFNIMIAAALEEGQAASAAHSDEEPAEEEVVDDDKTTTDDKAEDVLAHKEENVTRNVFDQGKDIKPSEEGYTLTHDDMKSIVANWTKGGSLKEATEAFALSHGIDNIDVLFPDAKNYADRPEFNQRRMEWVAGVLNSVRRSPFSRVKSIVADITLDEARARGYVKGDFKEQEWFGVTKRTTTPTTIYKKQQLDRDDVIDITDFDVVAWMKMEMRMMLEEEIARAILIGDGRNVNDAGKIKDPVGAVDAAGIRSIMNDHEVYVTTLNVNVDDANSDYNEVVEAFLRGRKYYKGTGMPTLYTTETVLTEMLLSKDGNQVRRYKTVEELAAAMRVSTIVAVEVMEYETDLLGIVVNLVDYNLGADKGGEINLFDDFDIDYNQLKYLMETRLSGALITIKSAIVMKRTASTDVLLSPPDAPTFVKTTGVVTIPTVTHVVYKNADTEATLSAGAQTALAAGATLNVRADAASGYFFANNAQDNWTFTRPTA